MKQKVILHIYDLNPQFNAINHAIGFGTYHTGIEFYGTEYSFGDKGITQNGPKQAQDGINCIYRESIVLGESEMTRSDMSSKVIAKLKKDGYLGRNYDQLERNCNHFSEALAKILLEQEKNALPVSGNIQFFFKKIALDK